MRAENSNFESGLAKTGSLGKEKLHFTNKISRLQKLTVNKESYQVPAVCTGRGGFTPLRSMPRAPQRCPCSTENAPKRFYLYNRVYFFA